MRIKPSFQPSVEVMEERQLLSGIHATITDQTPNSVLIQWTPTRGVNGYIIQEAVTAYRTVIQHRHRVTVPYTKWINLTTVNKNTTSITVGGLVPGTVYSFDVAAKNRPGLKSSPLTIRTLTPPPPVPPVPGGFTLTYGNVTQTSLTLNWTPSAYATNYGVYYYANNTWIWLCGTTSTYASITNLAPSTTYYFNVVAFNITGHTSSNVVACTTQQPPLLTITTVHPIFNSTDPSVKPLEVGWHYIVVNPAANNQIWGLNPVWSDVHQEYIGDCWLMSSEAEVAYRSPYLIENLFHFSGDFNEVVNGVNTTVKAWTVTVYDNSHNAHSILVDNMFAVNQSGNFIGDMPQNGFLWPALFEKAYCIAAQNHWVTVTGALSNAYDDMTNGQGNWALKAITGHNAGQKSMNTSTLDIDFSSCYIVILTPALPTKIDSHVDNSHYYALLNDRPGDSWQYTVDNPWNTADSQYYGSLFYCNSGYISNNYYWYDYCSIA